MSQHEITMAERIRARFPSLPKRLEWKLSRRYYDGDVRHVHQEQDIPFSIVLAYVRHTMSGYEEYLSIGYTHEQAREAVRPVVYSTLQLWE